MSACPLDTDLREQREDPEDARLDVAPPPVCVYHRDDGHRLTLAPGARWGARVIVDHDDAGVWLYRPGARRTDRHGFAVGVRLAKIDLPRSDPSSGTWAVVDGELRLVVWLVGVPQGEPWQDDPRIVLGGTHAFGP